VRECKIRASLLLKALQSGDMPRALAAADRLRVLPHFAPLTPERVVAWRDDIRRKHALAAIAAELGFASWSALRDECDRAAERPAPSIERLFDRPANAVYLNHWCKTYAEARLVQVEAGGFLFPYRSQFVVAPAGLLSASGVDAHDPDWELIGHDWVKPRDPRAHARLSAKLSGSGF
jgi:hypothetical protein